MGMISGLWQLGLVGHACFPHQDVLLSEVSLVDGTRHGQEIGCYELPDPIALMFAIASRLPFIQEP